MEKCILDKYNLDKFIFPPPQIKILIFPLQDEFTFIIEK